MTTGALLAFAAAALIAGIIAGPRLPRLWLGLVLAGLAAGLAAAVRALGANEPAWEWRSPFPVGSDPLHLRLDALSALFLVLVAVIGGTGAVYAREYWSQQDYPASAPRGRAWWSALLLSLGFVLVAANGLHFLIGWELFTLSAYFLVTLDRQWRQTRAAGWLYLAASHAGTLCLFAFFSLLAVKNNGSWELGPMRDNPAVASCFWIALIGFGVKGGIFPLHVWLPSAHANAPSHVSAILSGVAIKMGIYGLVRFSGWLPLPLGAGWVVIGLGSVGALLGIAFAFAQNDLKRQLAYSSVENIGVILIGLGGALLGATPSDAPGFADQAWGRLALAGALLHIWNHGLFKALLFFGAGSVLHATGTREMSRLGGLWRVMPWTAACFALGAIAISGLPPLNGFVSEWLVYLGLFDAAISRGPAAWATIPAAILLATTGALALATFVKASAVVFLGAPRTSPAARAHESGVLMRGAMLVLAAGCVALGFAPLVFWPAIARAIGVWHAAWTSAEAPGSLGTLTPAHLALAVIAALAATWLWRRARTNGRRALTWDCGYAAPSPRMQYTSGSFAGIAAAWFGWILQRERSLRRPRTLFPERGRFLERVPETVLERVIAPVADLVLRVSHAARRLQHGRLQFYIVYVVLGLAALGTLVVLGESS